jgi:tRNA(Arg) A34 adenosine deaminase TadA
VEAWNELEPAWRAAFELAWEAYGADTIPVGAVITRDGEVVARGRNRVFDAAPPPTGQVAETRIAHAEMNALAQLGTEDRFSDAVLWSTLEPCPMCIGATWLATIGVVRYAGDDSYGGAARLIEAQLERIDRARSDPLEVEGPLPGPFGVLGAFLHVEWFLRARPQHRVTEAFRACAPDLVALADRVRLYDRRGAPLEEALQHFLAEV